MARMETITVWTNSPLAEQRLNPRSPLARDALGIIPVRACVPLVLDNHFVIGHKPRSKSLFDEVQSLALTGRR